MTTWRWGRGTPGPVSRGVAARLVSLLVVLWLVIGLVAAAQRHYFADAPKNCAKAATIAVTVLAGPLNYAGANPKVSCTVPEPSK